jgi:uncharacterized membrane protein
VKSDQAPTPPQPIITHGKFRTLRKLAILLILLGWGLPIAIMFIASFLPVTTLRSIQQLLGEHRWVSWSAALCGLFGVLMLAISSAYIRSFRPYRILFVILGGSVFLPILGMALAVDSQPPGSALAMIISLTAVILIPVAIVALVVGLLGLLLFIPFSTDNRSGKTDNAQSIAEPRDKLI